MAIQVTENERGIRNLYFGHPFSRETYTNSVMLRTPVSSWIADFEGMYSGNVIELMPEIEYSHDVVLETEHRVIRGTKVMFIGDYEKVLEMNEERLVYFDLKNKAMIKVNNPEFLEFEVYTKKILNDPLKNIFDLTDIKPETAKKYMDYAVKYDKDKKYSDRLILKPFFVTCDSGVMILTDDFVDFNFDLAIDPENGVAGVKFWISENTSKYTEQYMEI